MKFKFLMAAVTGLLLSISGAANAGLILGLDATGTGNLTNDFTWVVGQEFTLNNSMTIRSLGAIDADGGGLSQSHEVGLWNLSGSLLAYTVIDNTSVVVASQYTGAQWYMNDIIDTFLSAGTYRIAALFHSGGDKMISGAGTQITPDTAVSISQGYVRTTNYTSASFQYPTRKFISRRVAATFSSSSVNVEQVPEPSTLAIFALGMIGLASRRFMKQS